MNKNFIFVGIATVIALYGLLCIVSVPLANVFLSFAIFLSAILLVGYFVFRKKIYTLSIYIVPARYHAGANAIKNESCTVTYYPGDKLLITDNTAKNECNKRYFILKNSNTTDIGIIWYNICRNYNRYSTLGSLAELCRTYAPVDILVEKNETKPKKEVIDRTEYRNPDTIKIKPKTTGPEIVEFSNLQTSNRTQATSKEEEMVGLEEFLTMGDIMKKSAQKVNVNTATAGELAVLNGINIAIAKKLVEHRNLNGDFKSIDEFIEVAEVAEHFIPQIKELAVLSDKPNEPDDAPNEGRLLDW